MEKTSTVTVLRAVASSRRKSGSAVSSGTVQPAVILMYALIARRCCHRPEPRSSPARNPLGEMRRVGVGS